MSLDAQCAVGCNSKLLNADHIDWFHNTKDKALLHDPPSTAKPSVHIHQTIQKLGTNINLQGSHQLTLTNMAGEVRSTKICGRGSPDFACHTVLSVR
jgi:hypothetical protein